jgi:thiamine kinase-like enzyme
MPSGILKSKAAALDAKLKNSRFQTLLHGDAKPPNFCWNSQNLAAAVDFQYIGPGCGIRDVAYLLDCWLDESGPSDQADHWLELYFGQFRQALAETPHSSQAAQIEQEWRELYPVAWSDFSRFMLGWGHPAPLGRYSQHQLEQALKAC